MLFITMLNTEYLIKFTHWKYFWWSQKSFPYKKEFISVSNGITWEWSNPPIHTSEIAPFIALNKFSEKKHYKIEIKEVNALMA